MSCGLKTYFSELCLNVGSSCYFGFTRCVFNMFNVLLGVLWICTFALLSSGLERKLDGLVKPYNLLIVTHNLNAQLSWDIQVENVTSLNDVDLNHDVVYTVFFYTWVEEDEDHLWIAMPNCSQIRQKSCDLSLVEPYWNEYKVGVAQSNGSYMFSVKQNYDPSLYERLYAPEFKVSFDGSDVIVGIHNPPKVTWSGELLVDFLHEFDLEYFVKYWIKKVGLRIVDLKSRNVGHVDKRDDSSQSTPHIITRPAEMETLRFPVERTRSDTVCVRLLLQGDIAFNPGYWSSPKCITDTALAPSNNLTGKVVAIVVASLVLLVVITGAVYTLKKKYSNFMKSVHRPIPNELRDFALGIQADITGDPCSDYELEEESIYHPCIVDGLNSEADGEAPYSETLDKQHSSIANNNYVKIRADKYVRNRPPSLTNVSAPDDVSGDISDYVGVPSPDSGLGLRMEF